MPASARLAADDAPPLVAPWWPFGASSPAAIDALRGADATVPAAEPSEPTDAVLQRCAPLDVTVYGANVTDQLGPAYARMTDIESQPLRGESR